MAASIRVELNQANIRSFLKSAKLAAVMMPTASRIKAAADAGAGGAGHEIRTLNGTDRVSLIIATATPEAMVAEMENRNLTRAVEGGRG